jgi:hypothetical protein
MKRIWASGVICVILVILCILGITTTKRVSADLTQTVTQAKEAALTGNIDEAYRLSRKAVTDWHDQHEVLCVYMPHARLEAIDQTLAALPELVKNGANDQFAGECDRGITQIDYLNEAEVPNIQNIF